MTNVQEEIIARQIHNWDRLRSILKYPVGKSAAGKPDGVVARQPVITTSRERGCNSLEVMEKLSRCTGYEIFGRRLVKRVAEDMRVQEKIVNRLDERVRSRIKNMVDGMLQGRVVDQEEYTRSLLRVLHALIAQGGVILLGRGATFVVKKEEGIRVRLIAPMEQRVEALVRNDEVDKKTALASIRTSDRERAEFVRSVFGKEITDPLNYDLTINLGEVSTESASRIILRALEPYQA